MASRNILENSNICHAQECQRIVWQFQLSVFEIRVPLPRPTNRMPKGVHQCHKFEGLSVLLFAFSSLFLLDTLVEARPRPPAGPPPSKAVGSPKSGLGAARDVSQYVERYLQNLPRRNLQYWAKTPHWKTTLNKAGGPAKQGCEGCHGPGAEHVAGGGDKTKIYVFKKFPRGNQCPLFHLPWRQSPAISFFGIRPCRQRGRLPRLPFASSCRG